MERTTEFVGVSLVITVFISITIFSVSGSGEEGRNPMDICESSIERYCSIQSTAQIKTPASCTGESGENLRDGVKKRLGENYEINPNSVDCP